jgi:acyl-CoA thioesterase-1
LLATLAVLATANPVAAKPAQILVVGDSLSAGYGLSSGEGWVDLLTKKLAREKSQRK